jgi:hypothetical protein
VVCKPRNLVGRRVKMKPTDQDIMVAGWGGQTTCTRRTRRC